MGFILGGQRALRGLWHRYFAQVSYPYSDIHTFTDSPKCHAVAYMVDASNRDRLDEGWAVFGGLSLHFLTHPIPHPVLDDVLMSPQISGIPLLLLANKQDAEGSMTVEEIRENHEEWWIRRQQSLRSPGLQEGNDTRRMASLEVMGISALKG